MTFEPLKLVLKIPSVLLRACLYAFSVIFVPWRSTFEPIQSLINADADEKDDLTKAWRDRKLAKLTFVGVACALAAGVTVQAISWPQSPDPASVAAGLWYGRLMLDLVAVCLATQQTVALNRLSCYKDGPSRIRILLGEKLVSKDEGQPERWTPRVLQVYVWQTPIMLLNFGVALFVGGLLETIRGIAG